VSKVEGEGLPAGEAGTEMIISYNNLNHAAAAGGRLNDYKIPRI